MNRNTRVYTASSIKILKIIGIIMLVFSGVLLSIAIIVGINGYISFTENEKIIKNGNHTMATITDCADKSYMHTTISGKVTEYYKADISYIVGEKSYEYEGITVNDREKAIGMVEIYYDKDDPSNPITDIESGSVMFMVIVCAATGGAGVVFLIVSVVFLISVRIKKKKMKSSLSYQKQNFAQENYPQYQQYPQQQYGYQNPQNYPNYSNNTNIPNTQIYPNYSNNANFPNMQSYQNYPNNANIPNTQIYPNYPNNANFPNTQNYPNYTNTPNMQKYTDYPNTTNVQNTPVYPHNQQ